MNTHCKRGHEWNEENTYTRKNGWRICKKCQSQLQRENPVHHSLNWQKRNPDMAKRNCRSQALKKYNLTPEQYDVILSKQNGVCLICKGVCVTGKRLAVDHCHRTKKVRGLLCASCNNGLGRFKDSPELLDKAAEYLRHS